MYHQLLLQRLHIPISSGIYSRSYSYISKFKSVVSSNLLLRTQPVVASQVCTFWESFPYSRVLLAKKDGFDKENYELIYRSRMFNYVFYGQLGSIFILGVQIYGSVYHLYKSYIGEKVDITSVGPFSVHLDSLTFIILCFFTIQNLLIYVAAQNVLLRVYYCEKTNDYAFVSLDVNPFKSRVLKCKPGDLKLLSHTKFEILTGNHELHEKRYFMRYDLFKTMYHYNQLIDNKYE